MEIVGILSIWVCLGLWVFDSTLHSEIGRKEAKDLRYFDERLYWIWIFLNMALCIIAAPLFAPVNAYYIATDKGRRIRRRWRIWRFGKPTIQKIKRRKSHKRNDSGQ